MAGLMEQLLGSPVLDPLGPDPCQLIAAVLSPTSSPAIRRFKGAFVEYVSLLTYLSENIRSRSHARMRSIRPKELDV